MDGFALAKAWRSKASAADQATLATPQEVRPPARKSSDALVPEGAGSSMETSMVSSSPSWQSVSSAPAERSTTSIGEALSPILSLIAETVPS